LVYCSNKANTIIESWNVLWFSTVQNRMEKIPPLLNLDTSIIRPAKHNYSKTTQNMVLNCKWQIQCARLWRSHDIYIQKIYYSL
jgi:hypothetical protein